MWFGGLVSGYAVLCEGCGLPVELGLWIMVCVLCVYMCACVCVCGCECDDG